MRPESGAAEALKALKARAHVEMTSATVWRLRGAREQIQFLVLPFELFMVLISSNCSGLRDRLSLAVIFGHSERYCPKSGRSLRGKFEEGLIRYIVES